jgi:hypothetical protein
MPKVIQIKLSSGEKIVVQSKEGKCHRIESDLKAGDGSQPGFDDAVDGLESLILAHAGAGVDITDPKYVEGIETALEAIANEYD